MLKNSIPSVVANFVNARKYLCWVYITLCSFSFFIVFFLL